MHYEDEKSHLAINPEDSFSSFVPFWLDPKPASWATSHHEMSCPEGAVWSFKVTPTSCRGSFLCLWQLNILSERDTIPTTHPPYAFMAPQCQEQSHQGPLMMQHGSFTVKGDCTSWALVLFSCTEMLLLSPEGLSKLAIRSAGQAGVTSLADMQ